MSTSKDNMRYTLITSQGKIMQFYIEDVANLYQSLYGGVVFCDKIVKKVVDNASTCVII